MSHTPGPWMPGHMVDDDNACDCRSILSEHYMGSIATVDVWNGIEGIGNGDNDSPPLEEAKANAHLIAAAPDLLEALETIDGYFRSGNSVPVERATIKADTDAVRKMKAAIAKAKGET